MVLTTNRIKANVDVAGAESHGQLNVKVGLTTRVIVPLGICTTIDEGLGKVGANVRRVKGFQERL